MPKSTDLHQTFGTFNAVNHEQVERRLVVTTKLVVDAVHVWEDSHPKRIFTPLAVKLYGEQLGPHGMPIREGLQPAELSAALEDPRTSTTLTLPGESGVTEVVRSVVSGIGLHGLRLHEVELLREGLVLERVAEVSALSVLDELDCNIRPVEQELPGRQVFSTELLLEGVGSRSCDLLLYVVAEIAQRLHAVCAALHRRQVNLLVEVLEILDSLDDGTRGNRADGEVRVLVAEPSGHGSRVAAAHGDPRVLVDAVQVLGLDGHDEVGEVLECLLHRQQLHLLELEAGVAVGHRLAVVTVLQHQNQALGLLRQENDPLASGWDARTCVLTADEQVDWPDSLVEEAIDHPVPLLPRSCGRVVVMVEHLVEPQLSLVVVGNRHWSLPVGHRLKVTEALSAMHCYQQKHRQRQEGFTTHRLYY